MCQSVSEWINRKELLELDCRPLAIGIDHFISFVLFRLIHQV